MIRVNNIHLSLDYDDKSVRKAVAQQLRIEEKSIKSCKIFRRSVDARKKDNIYFLTTVCCRSRSGWIVCGTYSGKKRCKSNSY